MLLQSSLSIERMCQLVPVSRRSFYRSLKEQRPAEEVTEVRSVIQQIALEHRRRYGYRQTATVQRFSSVMPIKATVKIGPEIDAKLYKEFATVVEKNGLSLRHLLEKAIEHYKDHHWRQREITWSSP